MKIAAEAGERYSRIVCMGGDGTLSETISGLLRLPEELRPEVGYIPMGTANDSALTLGLSRDPVMAAYTAATGRTIPLDIGRFGDDRYFTYVAAFGAFTEVSYETPQDQKNMLGWMAYAIDAMSRIPKLTHRRCRIEFDDRVLEDDFILCAVTNTRRFGGFIRLDDSLGISLSDGLFEVILVRTPESVLQLGPIVSDILANNYGSKYVSLVQSSHVRFVTHEPVSWCLDGEDGGQHSSVICENLRRAVRVLVNE